MKFKFAHNNFNVTDLDRSLRFYEEALGLKEVRRKEAEDGSFIIVYLGDGETGHLLELTWLRDWEKDHYDLGDNEFHLAFTVDDFDAAAEKILALNGKIAMEKFAIPSKCWQGYFTDADNNTFGLVQIDENAK